MFASFPGTGSSRLLKRILVPSGDHFGLLALSANGVSWRAFVPSAFIAKIAPLFFGAAVSLRRWKAIFVPPGDQVGLWSSVDVGVFFWVSWVSRLELAFMVKMAATAAMLFLIGPNARSNAILAPDGV